MQAETILNLNQQQENRNLHAWRNLWIVIETQAIYWGRYSWKTQAEAEIAAYEWLKEYSWHTEYLGAFEEA